MGVISAHCVVTAATWHAAAPKTELSQVLYKIVTPYRPQAWLRALQDSNLMHLFPTLVHNLTHGAPIGNLPPLTYTFIPDNLTLADIDPDYMDSFLADEIISGCMDGPYSVKSAQTIFNGHFRTAPLGFIEKPSSSALRRAAQ